MYSSSLPAGIWVEGMNNHAHINSENKRQPVYRLGDCIEGHPGCIEEQVYAHQPHHDNWIGRILLLGLYSSTVGQTFGGYRLR